MPEDFDDSDMINAFLPIKNFKKSLQQCSVDRQDRKRDNLKMLVSEHRKINVTEREESFAVQYLAFGGLQHFSAFAKQCRDTKPLFIGSSIHSGGGQQTFGYSRGQKADLMLVYHDNVTKKSSICYHNYHGHMWHYLGHMDGCPLNTSGHDTMTVREITAQMDIFRYELARAWSLIRPEAVIFDYSVSYACQMYHGCSVPSLNDSSKHFFSVKECLLQERKEDAWLPRSEKFFEHEGLKQLILNGHVTGFVTIKGGRENIEMKFEDPAGSRFGFCVQAYAPSANEISLFTKNQIAQFYNWGVSYSASDQTKKLVDEFIAKQPARTINSGTFHVAETISTTYLQWLMKERQFEDFEITHFLAYEFRDWSRDFLEPVLQMRHECKQRGDTVAAECLKLIGNGSYGYNGLESCNYDSVYLLTEKQLAKKLVKGGPFAHRKLKPIIRLGVVQLPDNNRARKSKEKKKRKKFSDSHVIDLEACDDDDDDDDDDDVTDCDSVNDLDRVFDKVDSFSETSHTQSETAISSGISFKHYLHWKAIVFKDVYIERAQNTPLQGRKEFSEKNNVILHEDHTYAKTPELSLLSSALMSATPPRSYSYHFLYLVTVSGSEKKIFNNLSKAVAVLSNSKRLFLGHLSVMFQSLDPCLAELSYVDTDSCVWSLSKPKLEDCLLYCKRKLWSEKNIFADELSRESCHGKMKLEGMFVAGQFRTVKIYRLYKNEEELPNSDSVQLIPAYTRCKGVNRYIATRLPNEGFQSMNPTSLVVHRNALRPTPTGEIHIVHEARSVSCPFNLKRYVCDDGYHTMPFFSNVV